jgi:cobalt/nickel transport system permease protein
MHIPDGIVSNTVVLAAAACAAPVVTFAYFRAKKTLSDRIIPISAGLAAFIFVAQLINFPIGMGTSGHLTGAFLLTFTIGPWLSILVLTLVLTIQAFIFQDGGILALPVNILNIAILASLSSYLFIIGFLKLIKKNRSIMHDAGIVLGCMISLFAAAALISIEFWISEVLPLFTVLQLLLVFNFFIGLIEGVITVLIISFLNKVNFKQV